MALFQRPERGIGRGEVAESQIEAPLFAGFTFISVMLLIVFHLTYDNVSYTVALAISLIVFSITIIRVEIGLYVLTVAMLLSPEIEAGSVGTHDERGLNIRYDDILIIIIFIGVLVKQAFEGRFALWRNNPIIPGIAAYFSVCLISSLGALRISVPAWDRSVAFFVLLKMLEFYLVFFVVSLVITNVKALRRQLIVFFAVSLIVCIYGIVSIGTLDRVSAPFESGGTEPNTLGGYLMIVMCVAGGLFCYAPGRRWKVLFSVIVLVAFYPFIMTLSRASYMSLLVAFVCLGIFGRKPLVLATVAIILIASPYIMPEEVINRINYTFQPGGVPIEIGGVATNIEIDKSTYERVYVWEKVRFNMGVWPWFGGGVSWDTVLDSQYARVFIETGIVGMAAFVFMLTRIIRTSWQAFRWNSYWVLKGLSLGMVVTTIGLIVHGLGTISFLIVRIMEPFWLLMALTVVAREIAVVDYQQKLGAYYASEEGAKEADYEPHRAGTPDPSLS